jgi:tetratricopeptide (TPR) repeat protein
MSIDITALTEKAKSEFQSNRFSEAAADFQACLDQLIIENQPLEIAEMRNNLSVALLRDLKPQAALDAVLGTDQTFAQVGDVQKQGMALANTASAYEVLKENDLAAGLYQSAIECFKISGDKQLQSITLRSLSNLQLKTGKKYSAISTLQAAYSEKPHATLKDKFFASALGQLMNKLFLTNLS